MSGFRAGRCFLVVGLLVGSALAGCKPPQPQPTTGFSEQPRTREYEPRQSERQERRSSRAERSEGESAPGAFDFYLLNLSWSPEFCVTHANAAECAAHPGFVLHGLWPQNSDGSYPQHCGNAPGPANPGSYSDIFPDSGLLRHEWQTHGTCTGLAPDAYFSEARAAFHKVAIPSELQRVSGELQMPPQQIIADFAKSNPSLPPASFALSRGNNRLTAIEVCLTKDLQAASCASVRSCRANVVKVTPPGAQ